MDGMDRFMAGRDLLYSWYSPSVSGLNRPVVWLVRTAYIAGSDHLQMAWPDRWYGWYGPFEQRAITDAGTEHFCRWLEPNICR